MTDKRYKLRHIYLPYLYVSIFCILFLSALNLTLVESGLVKMDENVVTLIIPILFPAIPVFIWMWPRLKLLMLKPKDGKRWNESYFLIAWVFLAIPSAIAQRYIADYHGEISELKNISELAADPPAKFYTIKNYYVDKRNVAVRFTAATSGKFNKRLNYKVYVAAPIYDAPVYHKVEVNGIKPPVAWLSWENNRRLSNQLSQATKDSVFRDFAARSQSMFNLKSVEFISYFKRMGYNSDYRELTKAIRMKLNVTGNMAEPIVLSAGTTEFSDRGNKRLIWLIGSFIAGSLLWLGLVLIPRVDNKDYLSN